MDKKDKEPKGTAATASKMAASKGQPGGESPSPGQGATSSQNQGGMQNQGATGTQYRDASITPQQNQGAVGSQQNQGATGSQQTQGTQGQNSGGQDLLQQAKQTTNEVVNQVQQQATSQLNRQKETTASELNTVVNAVRRFGETLNNEGQGPIARFAAQYGDKAANSLDRVARYLRDQDPKRLFNDVQNFGRRQPALLLGGAFLLGFCGARIIRTSMEAAAESSTSTGGRGGFMNTGTRSSANPGAQHQSFNANISGAQQPSPPLNPGL
ncbi:MAG TPA: hypothetical protein VK274_03945 [Pyrinomonadaceae bacterium]|nr:hypothetical protein [Pyrinomonadaceae bacterium]